MGEHGVMAGDVSAEAKRRFRHHLLNDLRALEWMLDEGLVESDVCRIGAEQELFLVDDRWSAAPVALELLEKLDDHRFTTELGLFNLEFNLEPSLFEGDCLRRLEQDLVDGVRRAREAAAELGGDAVLCGILPTLHRSDLDLDRMTPLPRYQALNDAMREERREPYSLRIRGLDELKLAHDSVMLEACNTSFQVHFQVSPGRFARIYNIAQLASGPVLAAATNSPLLFGRRLWHETRIALFQQSLETRGARPHLRQTHARVRFGDRWIRGPMDIFRDDVARFRVLLSSATAEDPFAALDRGATPRLTALCLFNGTVYRWNRVCYGISDGRPHLRIENRMLPSGPTPRDEVANTALWLGLLRGLDLERGDVTREFDFDDVKANFVNAAQRGLHSQLVWDGGTPRPAQELLLDTLIPLARRGLAAAGLDPADVEGYLGTVEERVRRAQTGSMWMLRSMPRLRREGRPGEGMRELVAAMAARSRTNAPVHEWSLAGPGDAEKWGAGLSSVERVMDTDPSLVHQDEPVELVASMMDWNRCDHVLVEDDDGALAGVVSQRTLLRLIGTYDPGGDGGPMPVSEVMRRDPITIAPSATVLEAIELMSRERVGCLPVVRDGHLVGMVAERDFLSIARALVERELQS